MLKPRRHIRRLGTVLASLAVGLPSIAVVLALLAVGCPPSADPETVPSVDVSPGDSLVIPTGWSFQFSAGPDSPLRFLCHTTPPWPGEDEAVPVERGGLGDATV